jgi:hypothetical protein
MHVENTLTRSEYRKIAFAIYRFWTFPIILILSLIGYVLTVWNFDYGFGIFIEWFFLLLFVMYLFLFLFVLYSIFKATYSKSKATQHMFIKEEIDFEDDIVTVNSAISKSVVKWDAFLKWRKVAGSYLLYTIPTVFLVVKESSLPIGKTREFESLLTSKIGLPAKR